LEADNASNLFAMPNPKGSWPFSKQKCWKQKMNMNVLSSKICLVQQVVIPITIF